MATIDQQLEVLIDDALRRGAVLFAVFASPLVFVSIARAVNGDWDLAFSVQAVCLLAILPITALRHQISRMVLGSLMLCICIVAAWSGLYSYGVLGSAGHWLMAIAMFIAGMLYSLRGMVMVTPIMLGGMLFVAGLHLSGAVVPAVPPADFVTAPYSWLVEALCALLFMAFVLPSSNRFVNALRALMSDVEARRDKIAYLAEHDELTGLPRLNVARDRLSLACHRARRTEGLIAVLFIDLDGFKQINDSYGHEAGDCCLRMVGSRLAARLRSQDTAARFGGDEFVVVLEVVADKDAAAQIAAQLIELITQPIEFEGDLLQIGVSIGIALYPESGSSVSALLRNADQAMYRAKRAGSNGFTFSEIAALSANDGEQGDEETSLREEHSRVGRATDTPAQPGLFEQWLGAIVTRSIVVIAGVLTLAVTANIWRIVMNSAAPNILPTAMALVVVLALVFWREQVSLRVKMAVASGVGLLIGVPGLFLSGLAGPGIGWALGAALFLVGIFYSWRTTLIVAACVLAAVLLAGVGFVTDMLVHRFDVDQASPHPATWLVFLLSAMAFNIITLSAWHLHKTTSNRLMEETTTQIAELVRLATFDQLTGLPSLRLAKDRLKMACSRAQRAKARAAVMLIDLDGFKAVNDSLGHDAGDHCLRVIAERMTTQVRAADTVARIGGDEFLVILDVINDLEDVADTARRLLTAIARPVAYGDEEFSVSGSIGIAVFPDVGQDGNTLRKSADTAMYAAKRAGKNCMAFS